MKKPYLSINLFILLLIISSTTLTLKCSDFEGVLNTGQNEMLLVHSDANDVYYENLLAAYKSEYSPQSCFGTSYKKFNSISITEVNHVSLTTINEDIDTDLSLSNQLDELIQQNLRKDILLIVIGFLSLGMLIIALVIHFVVKKNRKLKESEQRFQALHNASFGGIAIHDQGTIIECNQGLSEISGYSKDELIGMNGLLLLKQDQRDFVMSQIAKGCEVSYESQGVRKNGEIYSLRIEGRNIPYKGKTMRVTEFRDISEIKKQDEERTKLESQWGRLIEEMPLGFNLRELVFDENGKPNDYRFLSINDMYENMTGLKRVDIIGKTAHEVLPNIESTWIEKYAEVVLTGKTSIIEDYSQALGSYYRVVAYPYKENQFVIIAHDITEQKEYEKQIISKEAEKSRIISNLPGVFYLCKFDDSWTMLFMSDACELLTGYAPADLIENHVISFSDLIVPKYRKTLINQWNKSRELNQQCNVEYELSKKDGSVIWIWEKGKAFFQDGEWYIEGFLMDITNRKLSEERILYASNHDFLTGLPNRRYFDEKIIELDQFDNYPLIISMIDIDGLKVINDTYGHHIGDETIVKISRIIYDKFGHESFVARVGGDEFIIVSTKIDVTEFNKLRDDIFKEISNIKIYDIPISLSLGIAVKTNSSENIAEVIIKAENDMYSKKALHNQSSRNQVIVALFNSLKEKYEEERIHSDRVSHYCLLMGEKLNLANNEILELEFAGLIHDIGKITIPDYILKKPGKLSDDEWAIMKTHTTNGYQILRSADKYSNLADYALTHHEQWDGRGYPKGLKENEIPLYSRIISIADAYEAMTSNRPYRKALKVEDAIEELIRCAGSQFDPHLVDVFVNEVIVEEQITHEIRKENVKNEH